jgi:phosphoglycolate phosphatase-like HAD superfamily hydrolase
MYPYRFDAIVFDFDGTLVKSSEVKTWAFGKLYEEYGEDIVRQVISYQNEHEGRSRFIKFRFWQEHLLHQPYTDEIGENLSRTFTKLVFDAIVQAPYIEGALEFLKKHYQHIPLFIASGTPEQELREIIKKRSIKHFFQGVYGSPQTKKEILKGILAKHKLYPEQVLMLGDALTDWEGAQGVGAEFIGIQSGKSYNIFPSTNILLNNFNKLDKYVY